MFRRSTVCDGYIHHHYILFQISWKLGRMYSEMIFLRGFIHCDPHPGNILIRKGSKGKAEIIMLDHGLYRVSPLINDDNIKTSPKFLDIALYCVYI